MRVPIGIFHISRYVVLASCVLSAAMAIGKPVLNSSDVGIDPWASLDGRENAPTGTPQFPLLLNSYPKASPPHSRVRWPVVGGAQPPWMVAGVDYAVGVPAKIALKDPTSINMPGRVSIDAVTHIVTILGGSVVLDGYDFSLEGGWSVAVTASAAETMITNCRFGISTKSHEWGYQIDYQRGSGSFTLAYNTLDGGGIVDAAHVSTAISLDGNGPVIIEYNWIRNVYSDAIQLNPSGKGTVRLRYNLFENIGVGVSLGAHPDIVQTEGGPWTTIIENFNMIWQSNNVSDVARYGTQGFGFDSAGTVDTFDNSYNVVVTSKAGSMNRFTAITPLYVTGLASTHDNYIDPSNLGKFAQAGSSAKNSKFSNNIDMLTGRNIPTFGSR